MSPGDLDARLRSEMTRHADPLDDLDRVGALNEVLHRSARRRRMRRTGYVAASAVATVSAVMAGLVAVRAPTDHIPPEPATLPAPADTFERVVSSGDWQGHWSMTLGDGRVLGMVPPPGVKADEAPTDGASYRLNEQTLVLDAFSNGVCTELPPGVYTWSMVGDGLLLRASNEPCGPRRTVFAGLWQPPT